MKTARKNWLNRIFCHAFFNFPQYLLVQSVPKCLGLFENVATFQFAVIFDLTIVSAMENRTSTCLMYNSSHDKNNYPFIEFCF